MHDLRLNLLNNGSVARDHLASERTFMAYVRTSLALATAGIAFMQLLLMGAGNSKKATAKPMALSMVSLGLLVLAVGTVRFFSVQRTLPTGYFPIARVAIATVALCIFSVVVAGLCIILRNQHS
ncbi:hypothetical protein BKA70DRAFT_1125733 [Coprinopsis sp. MPI-PUGE-AT-0042]|nr:hypothetical protein BKA70DRAFT_1125733 [Coprinopsis sp. MPI-PUGE-AT-0042]